MRAVSLGTLRPSPASSVEGPLGAAHWTGHRYCFWKLPCAWALPCPLPPEEAPSQLRVSISLSQAHPTSSPSPRPTSEGPGVLANNSPLSLTPQVLPAPHLQSTAPSPSCPWLSSLAAADPTESSLTLSSILFQAQGQVGNLGHLIITHRKDS